MSATSATSPVLLPANQPRQFYRGGSAIAALRAEPPTDDFTPEDWVASTTTRFGQDVDGLSRLPDGRLLRDAVIAEPDSWLGAEHVATFGPDTALLVKLLDAGQRLPVHCHPSDDFARRHFGCRFGKTEAWVVIGAEPTDDAPPTVHIGFNEPVPADELSRWVADQDRPALLAALNHTSVAPGDTVFIPAGLPHAIGAGVFVVELQQPTDLSVTLEWQGFLADERAGHLGVGFDTALCCVDRADWAADDRWRTLVRHTGDDAATTSPTDPTDPIVELFGAQADPFFTAQRLHVDGAIELEPSFAVLIVLAGAGRLHTERGDSTRLRGGDTLVVPHAAGPSVLTGELTAIRCRPPRTAAHPG
ncbi:MAG TPA: class I mannose-6-phosphate isomerase [Pseudonocardiaceae bacterium]|jgi:mannose-6-phosphate isomerase|nr:class I mannose-6-phosphate isomerase [Pseudonocardiaceae bacterium]